MSATREYLRGSEEAILAALLWAHVEAREPVSAGEVQRAGDRHGIASPMTEVRWVEDTERTREDHLAAQLEGRNTLPPGALLGGGYDVFDFTDRTKRTLERLYRQGRVGKVVEGKRTKYFPLEEEE